jgi:hypothetical protein
VVVAKGRIERLEDATADFSRVGDSFPASPRRIDARAAGDVAVQLERRLTDLLSGGEA